LRTETQRERERERWVVENMYLHRLVERKGFRTGAVREWILLKYRGDRRTEGMNFVEESREWRNGEKLMCTESWELSQREGSSKRERGLRDGCCCNMHEAERKSRK
jgi:hypothetical protein